MSDMTGQFVNDLGDIGKSRKEVSEDFVVELQHERVVAWEYNSSDVRSWTPRYKYFEGEDCAPAKTVYDAISSESDMLDELSPYGEQYSDDYDPEIPVQENPVEKGNE